MSIEREGSGANCSHAQFVSCLTITLVLLFHLLPSGNVLAERVTKIEQLITAARRQIGHTTGYNGSYQRLKYPNGDVASIAGVCTDVIIRAYRALGYDLQKLLHEDLSKNFELYPSKQIWGLAKPDTNIDHRRVPNMRVFFKRHGEEITLSQSALKLEPGDLLTWKLPSGVPHIGIVSDKRSKISERLLVIHNIGQGVQEEDIIDAFEMTGHYRYRPWKYQ